MRNFNFDYHIIIILVIMLVSGWFGGYLNYINNFDTLQNENRSKKVKFKYILLGIGAAFLVPNFLQMISSHLLNSNKNEDYLVFGGFCLIAAIFSRRFISTIGDKILEAAKNAEKTSEESKRISVSTQNEVNAAKERIEDVKLAVDLKNSNTASFVANDEKSKTQLIDLAESFIDRTTIPNYRNRLKAKAELGRKMGELIVRNKLPKLELFKYNQSEGMLLGLAYSVQLLPDEEGLDVLINISDKVSQLYTKYSILVSFDTLARNNYISEEKLNQVYSCIKKFVKEADAPLINKINDSLSILKLIKPDLEEV